MPPEKKNNYDYEHDQGATTHTRTIAMLRINTNGDILYASPECTHLLAGWNRTIGKSIPNELLTAARRVIQSKQFEDIKVKCNGNSFTFSIVPSSEENYVDLVSHDTAMSKESQFQEFKRQNDQLKKITEISQDILELCDVNSLLLKIVQNGVKLLNGTSGGIYLYDPKQDELIWHTGYGSFDYRSDRIEKGQHFSGKVWSAGKTIIERNSKECRTDDSQKKIEQAIIGTPLLMGEEFFGIVSICRCHENASFTSNDVELFERYNSLASVALKNARFYEKAQNQIKKREQAEKIKTVLFKISEAAGSHGSLSEMLSQIHKYVGQLIDTRNFYIALFEPEIERYTFPYIVDEEDDHLQFQQVDLRKSLTDYVRRTGEPLFVDKEKDEELRQSGEVELVGAACPVWMGAPLKTENETIGVVVVQHYQDENAYTRKDLQILSFVSDNIARAIERKRAHDRIKSSLSEKEFLLQEIHHRVKNNLQIVSSLLYLQSKKVSKELVSHFEESQNRIKSMALIHENLYRSEDFANIHFDQYVKSLTDQLMESYKMVSNSIRLELDIEKIAVPIQFAVPCGLVINELVTNSLKYGFPDHREGSITISMKRNEQESDTKRQKIKLVVKDNGVGLPQDFDLRTLDSLGILLVQNLVAQLDGEFKIYNDNGTSFEMNMIASNN